VTEPAKVTNDSSDKPVEPAVPAQTEKPVEAPPVPVETASAPLPVEKPLETAAPAEASEAAQPNGSTTNGAIANKDEDVEMKDAPAPAPLDEVAAPAPAPAPVVETKEAKEPKEPETTVAGEKRKADEVPATEDALASKKAKPDETAEATETTAAPVPVVPTSNGNPSVVPDAAASEPKKVGRPKKTQKEKVPAAPAGRTLRKTRSQGPVEV